jgi:uncharacterized protein with GYD domain
VRVIHLVKYTPEALTAIRENGHAAREAWARQNMAPDVTVVDFNWLVSGEWDAVNVVEVPDIATAFEMASTVSASGGVQRSEFLIAHSGEEADAAIAAAPTAYKLPQEQG